MIRIATEADVPQILEIYGPYVENTTVSFEYTVPTREAFLERFRTVTAQYPWLVWEEEGVILGYAYAAPPLCPGGLQLVRRAQRIPAARGRKEGHRKGSLRRSGGNSLPPGLSGALRAGDLGK